MCIRVSLQNEAVQGNPSKQPSAASPGGFDQESTSTGQVMFHGRDRAGRRGGCTLSWRGTRCFSEHGASLTSLWNSSPWAGQLSLASTQILQVSPRDLQAIIRLPICLNHHALRDKTQQTCPGAEPAVGAQGSLEVKCAYTKSLELIVRV